MVILKSLNEVNKIDSHLEMAILSKYVVCLQHVSVVVLLKGYACVDRVSLC